MSKLKDRLYYDFELNKLGFDFMGYEFNDKKDLSYHHIQPKHSDGETTYENGCLLCRHTSHNYIHLIEELDYKTFLMISKLLVEEKKFKAIDMDILKEMNDILCCFEKKYENVYTKRGVLVIKEDFIKRRTKKW